MAALGVRLAAALTVYRWVDSDQAVLGLMTLHILQGERPVFYGSQNYNGALEAYLTTPVVAIWGANDLTIRLVPLVLSAAFVALCTGLALRVGGPLAAVLTGAYLAFGPPLLLHWSTAAGAGYVEVLLLGTLLFGLAGDAPWRGTRSAARGALVGIVLGLGMWADPLMVPYIVTVGVVALPALLRGTLRPAATALLALAGGTLLGLTPVLATRGASALSALVGLGTGATQRDDWLLARLGVLGRLVTEAGPVLLGCIRPGVAAGPFGADIAAHAQLHALGVVLVVILAAFLILGRRCLPAVLPRVLAGRGDVADLLIVLLPVSVGLFVVSHYSVLPWTTWEPRYLLPVYTATGAVLALLVPRRPEAPRRRVPPALVAILGVACLIGINMAGLAREQRNDDIRPLVSLLVRHGTQAVFADYWLAYRLTFESGERLIGVAILGDGTIGPHGYRNRFPAYRQRAQRASRVAWVVPIGAADDAVRRLLTRGHARARRTVWGPFAVYTDLSPPVKPPDLASGGWG